MNVRGIKILFELSTVSTFFTLNCRGRGLSTAKSISGLFYSNSFLIQESEVDYLIP